MLFIQLTGLSGAGKISIAHAARDWMNLNQNQFKIEVIDADEYRKKLHPQLGFSREDRVENIRRLGKIAGGFRAKGFITIVAAINPYELARNELERKYGAKTVWIKCGMEEVIRRDTKGLYKRALMSTLTEEKIHHLTSINDPYEAPENADLIIDTETENLPASTARLTDFIFQQLNRTS